jgi:hypothetical protein
MVNQKNKEDLKENLFAFGTVGVGLYLSFVYLIDIPIETKIFIIAIAGLSYSFQKKFDSKAIVKAPSILMTSGILATFFGIAHGLLDFNSNNIQQSLPNLIGGIKTAFWASVYAVFCAVCIKLRDYFFGHEKTDEVEGATVEDIVEHLIILKNSISGDEDSALTSQFKLMRQDSNDRLDKLSKNMTDFYEKMADSNSQALISALEEVIKDFNAKINEQFGENFKQLNEAVGKMLEWQQQYKNSVDEMIKQQTKTALNMEKAVEKYELVLNNSTKFNEVAISFENIVGNVKTQREHLENSLALFSRMVEDFGDNIPKIEGKIESAISNVEQEISKSNQNLVKNLEKQIINIASETDKRIQEFNKIEENHLRSFEDIAKKMYRNVEDGASKTSVQISNSITESNNRFVKNLETEIESANKGFRENIEAMIKQTRVQNEEFQKVTADTFEKFGKLMTGLSEAFLKNYEPITNRLGEILDKENNSNNN